jgi:YVTN family beta-propeller protein
MNAFNRLSCKVLAAFFVILAPVTFFGCGSAQTEQVPMKPMFFPPAPEKPRLQFLKSFSGADDLGVVAKPGFLERFVLGDSEEEVRDSIGKPYGVAVSEGKLYVCDVGRRLLEVLDLEKQTFSYLTKDRRLMNPVDIHIDGDKKYVSDPTAGAIFVFNRNDTLMSVLAKELEIEPVDVAIRGQKCYVTDSASNQIVVLDKTTGKEIERIGKEGDGHGQFRLISGLALDEEGNIYVTDKVLGKVTKFNEAGIFQQTIGTASRALADFVRPKGIAIDKEGRIWVVDAATDVAKIYSPEGRLLLFFGMPGDNPGRMNLPASIALDYDNVGLFSKYAVEGANIEFLVIVTNQFGPNKISVYGFGSFPEQKPRQETE